MSGDEHSFSDDSGDFGNGPEESEEFDADASPSLWDDNDSLEALTLERSVHGDETNEQLVRRMLDEAAPRAVQSIMQIAFFATNENTKLAASKYIVDQVLGEDNKAGKAKWEELVGEIVNEAELHANASVEE